jgi:hypothetical protein
VSVSFECFQLEVSPTGLSHVQISHAERSVSECDRVMS